jgi:uncharacterized membrane protein
VVVGVLTRTLREPGPAPGPAAPWRIWLSGTLALIGLGMATYLTIVHFVGTKILVCANGGIVNCQTVLTSPESYVFGIPVAVLGLVYYVPMSALCSPWAWRARDRRIHLARLAMVVLGIGFVLYLVSAELLEIKAICELCTVVHLVTFAQLILVMATVPPMLGWGGTEESPPQQSAATRPTAQGKVRGATGRQQDRPVAARSRRR